MSKRILFLTICTTLLLFGRPMTARAASPSPSPSPSVKPTVSPKVSPTPSVTPKASVAPASSASAEPTTQKLRERIERVIEEKREQVKGVLSDISLQRRGFIAEVQRVTAESITIKSNRNTYIIPVENSLVLLKKGQPLAIDDLAVGDWVIAIGNDDDNTFKPDRLVVSDTSLRGTPKQVTLGTLKTINTAKTQIEIEVQIDSSSKTVALTKSTKYEDYQGGALTAKDLKPTLPIVVISTQKDTTLTATRVRVIAPIPNAKP